MHVRFVIVRCQLDRSGACFRRLARALLQLLRDPRVLPRPAPRGRRGGLRAVSPRPPGVSLPWLTSFAPVCVSIFPTSRAEDLHKLATQFPTLADFDEAVCGKVNTVMGVARPASPALPVPAPASGFGGGDASSSCSRVPTSEVFDAGALHVAHTSHPAGPTAAAQGSRLAAIDLADAEDSKHWAALEGHQSHHEEHAITAEQQLRALSLSVCLLLQIDPKLEIIVVNSHLFKNLTASANVDSHRYAHEQSESKFPSFTSHGECGPKCSHQSK